MAEVGVHIPASELGFMITSLFRPASVEATTRTGLNKVELLNTASTHQLTQEIISRARIRRVQKLQWMMDLEFVRALVAITNDERHHRSDVKGQGPGAGKVGIGEATLFREALSSALGHVERRKEAQWVDDFVYQSKSNLHLHKLN